MENESFQVVTYKKRVKSRTWGFIIFTTVAIIRTPTVVLNMPTTWANRKSKTRGIFEGITQHSSTWFSSPPTDPSLSDYDAHLTSFETEQDKIDQKNGGDVDTRDSAWDVVDDNTKDMVAYVQKICRKNVSHALEIAHAANLELKDYTYPSKAVFSVTSERTGQAELAASIKGIGRCSHDWERTQTPDDAASWTVNKITPTMLCSTTVSNLTSGSIWYFRHRFILPSGATEWSNVIKYTIM